MFIAPPVARSTGYGATAGFDAVYNPIFMKMPSSGTPQFNKTTFEQFYGVGITYPGPTAISANTANTIMGTQFQLHNMANPSASSATGNRLPFGTYGHYVDLGIQGGHAIGMHISSSTIPIIPRRQKVSIGANENENQAEHQNHGIQINMTGSMDNNSTDTIILDYKGEQLNTGIKIKNLVKDNHTQHETEISNLYSWGIWERT